MLAVIQIKYYTGLNNLYVFIDSSVWVALFLDFDSQHKKAVGIFSLLDNKIYIFCGVISEVATVLTYKHSKAQADKFLDFITNNDDIVLFDNQVLLEINFFRNFNKSISFTDASLLFLSQRMNLSLITFDKQIIGILKRNNKRN